MIFQEILCFIVVATAGIKMLIFLSSIVSIYDFMGGETSPKSQPVVLEMYWVSQYS
jgi:hypothetical protein